MKTRKEIEKQLELAQTYLSKIEKEVPPGDCEWREQKAYINALQWVLYGE
jgi:hypothetical protein